MKELLEWLDSRQADYEVIRHERTLHTAKEGAAYLGIEVGQTAPTLLLKTDKGFAALVLSGDYGRVDMETVKELLSVSTAELASPSEVEGATGSTVGSVSMINRGVPTLMDRKLYRYDYVYGGTGHPETTLKIRPKDIERLTDWAGYIN